MSAKALDTITVPPQTVRIEACRLLLQPFILEQSLICPRRKVLLEDFISEDGRG
jgi:hypothetical protein